MSVGPNPSRAIPLSPESPPSEGIKETNATRFPQKRPQTPQSPVLSMNFPGPNNAPTSTSSQTASSQATSHLLSFSSPPTTQSVEQSQKPLKSMDASEGLTSNESALIDDLNAIPRQPTDRAIQPSIGKRSADIAMEADDLEAGRSPNKRPRLSEVPYEDSLNSPSTKLDSASEPQPAPDGMTLEQVQRNMGSAFLLCRKPHQSVRPHPSQSLLSIYNMQDLVASVAREDPVTKEKINKLRKSYDGQLKELGLSGRNKNYPLSEGQEGLRAMYMFPDDQWDNAKVRGKSIQIAPDLGEKLQNAVTLASGSCRNQEFWDNKIGHEPPKARVIAPEQRKPLAGHGLARVNGAIPALVRVPTDDRPKRSGRKRSYKDDSFDGYAEAYGDDDDDEPALKSGSEDGSRGLGRKRRKKDTYTTASPVTLEGRVEAVGIGR